MDVKKIKKDWFIEPNLHDMGYAFHSVRFGLLSAMKEVKNKAYGDLLDLGCGIMPYREFLMENENIKSYTGVDLAPTSYHNTVTPDIIWDGKIIPLEENSVDCVIATEFFEHYYDTVHVMKEIQRVLKPDGFLFFTVPFIWPLHEVPFDEFRFTPFSLQKKIIEAGFGKATIKPLGGYNHSLAMMTGLWLQHSGISGFKRKIIYRLFRPVYKWLIKNDIKPAKFDNYEMYSGLYGFVYNSPESDE